MQSFTKKLVLYCTGIIFVSFLVVYILFNVMVSAYIRAEAERELASGVPDVMQIASIMPYERMWVPGNMTNLEVAETDTFINIEFMPAHISPHIRWHIFADDVMSNYIQLEVSRFYATRGERRSIVRTDIIAVNNLNEIIIPSLPDLNDTQRAEVEFLVNYYRINTERFSPDQMIMVMSDNNTYYLRHVSHQGIDGGLSILLYTDVSSAMAFMSSMNHRLGLLLFLSGILSLIISLAMSARFKKAIGRLCRYAETIGHGNFNENAGVFNDLEFSQLSKSMRNMSNMLYAYENNQKQFFQNASHELRTPLMSIQGYAEGILEDIFTKEEAAQIILHEGKKMADLVTGLLYVSRIDSGAEMPETISAFDVKDLLHNCIEQIRPIAQKSEKQVFINLPKEVITIKTDAQRLERAIVNVLSNAIRHANSEVLINGHMSESNFEIVIKDDGEGINPQDLPHIFERFYKGENGNFGLGLAISKDIIKNMNGKIMAENLTGTESGAKFTITLPIY